MSKIICYSMYGLIGGPFPYGLYYSGGLDVLAKKLKAIGPDVEIRPTYGWSQWKKIADDIFSQPGTTKAVVIGHSMGANQTTAIASSLEDRVVDLLVAFDPTVWYPSADIGANVNRVLWFHGTSIFSPVGHGHLKPGDNFKGKFEKIEVNQRHEVIDDNTSLHDVVAEAVKDLVD